MHEDFVRLADLLAQINGTFFLSLNDHPEVRKVFRKFAHRRVALTYSLANGRTEKASRGKARAELIIHNSAKGDPS